MTEANEICRMNTVTLARRIRAKELSPVEVVEAVLGRLERLDPVLHAFTTVTADDARAEARRLEQDIAAGREVGPLAGVPTGVKDLICTKGVRTASGSCAYADFVPDEDDVVVERIKAAGAIVIGKTQVPEFGYSGTGQTPLAAPTANPWRLDRTSGGSSAGSGAAVAAGIGPFSLGSDGGGSVRIPASFCGIYGIRPTHGRLSLEGVVGQAPSYDTVGWFARDADLLARIGEVLLGLDLRQAQRPRHLIVATDAFAIAEPATAAALAPAVERLTTAVGSSEHRPVSAAVPLTNWFSHQRAIQGRGGEGSAHADRFAGCRRGPCLLPRPPRS